MSEHRTPGETTNLTGHDVLDDHHQKVGTVSDVLYDERGDPRWAIVDPGPMRAEKYVPVEGAYVTEGGELVDPLRQGPGEGRTEGQPRSRARLRHRVRSWRRTTSSGAR